MYFKRGIRNAHGKRPDARPSACVSFDFQTGRPLIACTPTLIRIGTFVPSRTRSSFPRAISKRILVIFHAKTRSYFLGEPGSIEKLRATHGEKFEEGVAKEEVLLEDNEIFTSTDYSRRFHFRPTRNSFKPKNWPTNGGRRAGDLWNEKVPIVSLFESPRLLR